MQKFDDVILNSNGQPVSGAVVLVSPTGTTSTATIYGDIAGTATRANPLSSDASGRVWFYGTNGRYDLAISGSYITTTTKTDMMLEDVPRSNLAELSTASAARTNLGLDSAGLLSTSSYFQTGNNLSEGVAATIRANIRGTAVALASTGQITPDFAASDNFTLAPTVNTTLATPSNPVVGQSGRIVVTQNATAKTLAYNSGFYKFAAGATATLSTAASAVDVLRYTVISSTSAECEMRNGLA